uniref:Uncharacterized protein n=1 Tax=Anopheles farauti TaxID=69004 RepID=A0A182Q523_9DIPT
MLKKTITTPRAPLRPPAAALEHVRGGQAGVGGGVRAEGRQTGGRGVGTVGGQTGGRGVSQRGSGGRCSQEASRRSGNGDGWGSRNDRGRHGVIDGVCVVGGGVRCDHSGRGKGCSNRHDTGRSRSEHAHSQTDLKRSEQQR